MRHYHFSFILWFIVLILYSCSGDHNSKTSELASNNKQHSSDNTFKVQDESEDNIHFSENLGLYLPIPEGYSIMLKDELITKKEEIYNSFSGDSRTMDILQQVVQNPKGLAFYNQEFLTSNLLVQGLTPMDMSQENFERFAEMFETYPDRIAEIDKVIIHEKKLIKTSNYEGFFFRNEIVFSDGSRTEKNVTAWVDYGKGMSFVFNFNNMDIDEEQYLSEVK